MIDIDGDAIRQAIRTLIAGLAALFISNYFPSSQSYWMILSAVLIVQIRSGHLIQSHVFSQLVAGLLAVSLVFVASSINQHTLLLALFLSLTSFVSIYLGFRYLHLFLPAYLVNLLAIISGGMPINFSETMMRASFVVCGVVIASLTTVLLWPSILRFRVKSVMALCLKINLQLLQTLFDIYLKKDYSAKHFFYEKRIYYLSRLFFYWIGVLRNLNGHCSNENDANNMAKIDRIFEIMMGLGALRYRVKDHSTFGMINQELTEILSALTDKFSLFLKRTDIAEMDRVETNIERLDEVYRGALQVASQEPIVYLFFICGLRKLNEVLNE